SAPRARGRGVRRRTTHLKAESKKQKAEMTKAESKKQKPNLRRPKSNSQSLFAFCFLPFAFSCSPKARGARACETHECRLLGVDVEGDRAYQPHHHRRAAGSIRRDVHPARQR